MIGHQKLAVAVLPVILWASISSAFADVGASSDQQQQSQANAVAQGQIDFSQNPAHSSQTILAAPSTATGSYAAGFSPYNCYGTTFQFAASVPGGSLTGGGGKGLTDCQLGWIQNDYARQAAVIDANNLVEQKRDMQIVTNLRCMVSSEAYDAIMAEYAEGTRTCHVKPKDYKATQDTTRNPDGTQQYVTAQTK